MKLPLAPEAVRVGVLSVGAGVASKEMVLAVASKAPETSLTLKVKEPIPAPTA